MIYSFIQSESDNHSVSTLCQVMSVSRSGYYDSLERAVSKQVNDDLVLAEEIKVAHEKSYCTYGKRRLQKHLNRQGYTVGLRRISRLMHGLNLQAKATKRFKVTTDSKHSERVSPNLLNRRFKVEKPNEAWVSDITYVRTRKGFAYLAVILDLYSRKIVGWSIDDKLHCSIVNQALDMAVINRKDIGNCLIHSDRGSQYASLPYRERLKKYCLKQSMSRSGDCWDNAPCESFFHTLKVEWIGKKIYQNLEEVKTQLFHYIEGFYNRFRMHSANGFYSPEEYENMQCAA